MARLGASGAGEGLSGRRRLADHVFPAACETAGGEELQKRSEEMTLHFAELQPSLVRALRFYDGLFGLFFEQLSILVSMHNWWRATVVLRGFVLITTTTNANAFDADRR